MSKFKVLSVVFILLFNVPHLVGQQPNEDGPTGGVFEVKLNKSSYLLLEPIYATFETSLEPTNKKLWPSAIFIRITHDGKVKVFRGLGMFEHTDTPQRLPIVSGFSSVLAPTDPSANPAAPPASATRVPKLFDEEEIVIERVAEFFPRTGRYQLQFEYRGVASNTVDITIDEPTGMDLEAFDILRSYKEPLTFNWVWKEENGKLKLEEFVNKYRRTVYGEIAAVNLSRLYYLNGGQPVKARPLLEELAKSPHKSVADDAQGMLNEILSRPSETQPAQK